ncbi:MAG: glycoside hydrolase family 5 protein [Mariniphaga sp.]|nr:glycoside hydrolase family 5 protein [Mariniphaga sp.]
MKYISFILLFLFITAGLPAQNHLSKISVKGKDLVNASGEVLQLRGVSFSDPDKLERDGQWNERYFQEAKDWGCNIVRFAVHPTRLKNRGWDEYFKLIDKGVTMAEKRGMYVIIDWHSIGNLNTERWTSPMYNTSWDETVKFWKTVAKRYEGNSTVAVYELYNEPTSQGGNLGELSWGTWRPTLEKLIDEINEVDDGKVYLVAGMNWGYFLNEVIENPVDRKNVAYTTHPYPQKRDQPWEPQWEKDWGHVADKYPIIATEFGFMDKDDRGAHIPCIADEKYGEAIINFFNKKNISYTVWCFDPNWGPSMIKDWDFTPTRQGAFFRNAMLKKIINT